jgi:glucose/arabinose dehydrogenase
VVESLEDRRLLAAFDVLVFSRTTGFRHGSINEGIAAIQQLGTANDFSVTATEDPAAFTAANLAQYEAVIFLSTTGDVLNASQQTAFEQYIAAGHGFVGIHSAADTEYDWAWYGGLVGAYFDSHPAIQSATIKVADAVHPATAGLPQDWTRTDEWYNFRTNPRTRVHVLATLDERTYTGGTMGFDHPIAWCHSYGGGRSFYTALGHTESSYSEPLFRQHLLGGIRYAAGAVAADDGATLASNFRKTVLADDTFNPYQLDVAPDGRVFWVEQHGKFRVWNPATGVASLVADVPVWFSNDNGLIGIALDRNFQSNGWVYLFYSAVSVDEQRVSRFTVTNNVLDFASEKILLHIPMQRVVGGHHAGALQMTPDGLLYVSTGDDTDRLGDADGYSPTDERPGQQYFDAQRTSGNTNSLSGKILRIRPLADGTYSVPAGNLFPADGSQGRPEVYVMGVRNPFRFTVDPETGWLYFGDIGPDAEADSATRGPMGYDEFNQARAAGNYGYPYVIANNQPYVDYDYATHTARGPYNPAALVNDSPNNTGGRNLPPAQPAWMWYPYGVSPQFPELGEGFRAGMSGPVYHYDAAASSRYKLPAYYDDTLLVFDWARNWVKEVKINRQTGAVHKINDFAPGMQWLRPLDMKVGPDGALYMIEFGAALQSGNQDSQIVRVEYLNNPQPTSPVTEVYVRGSAWSTAFKTYMEVQGLGDDVLGYRVDNKTGEQAILPWVNVNEIVLRYPAPPTGPAIPTPGTVTLRGDRPGGNYTVTAVNQIDPQTFALVLDRPLGNLSTGGENGVRVNLVVPGAGPAGSNLSLVLNALQGDVNHVGESTTHSVVAADFSDVKNRFFRTTSQPGPAGPTQYTVFHDVDGSGGILANDFSFAKARFFDSLQATPFPVIVPPTALFAEERLTQSAVAELLH